MATHSFALEELTFGLSNYGNFLATTLHKPESGNVRLRRIRVLGNRYRGHMYQKPEVMSQRFTRSGVHGGKLLALGGHNVEITDSDFLSSGCCLYLTRARGARIANNRFRMGRFGWFWLSGSDGVILEDNELLGGRPEHVGRRHQHAGRLQLLAERPLRPQPSGLLLWR